MADNADRAGELIEERMEQALAARSILAGPSETHCIDCDAPIPEQRRALGGITRCIECQEIHETRSR